MEDLKAELAEKQTENEQLQGKLNAMELDNREIEKKFVEWESA